LDEPFSSLDREGRKLISSVIREYVNSEDASVIIVSHDVNPIIDYADIVVKMENGRIISGEGYA